MTPAGFTWEKPELPPSYSWIDGKPGKAKRGKRMSPEQLAYARAYKRRQRMKWIVLGLVKPRTDIERAVAVQPEPAMQKVGSGPLSMWLPDRISDSSKSVGTYGCAMHRGRK